MTAMWIQGTLLMLGQATASPIADGPASAAKIESVWDFVVKGGPVMIPIGLCSLAALALIIERLIGLRRSQVIPGGFLSGLKKHLGNGHEDKEEALDFCRRNEAAIARIFAAGIRKLGASVEVVEKQVREAGEREVFKLRKYLRGLSVIGSIAPLLGLLGTIFGMITAFQTVATAPEALGRTELLAEGIYEAMITTAAGLVVAIPVVVAYNYFSSRVERLVIQMDQMAVEFIEEYAGGSEASARTPQLRPAEVNGVEAAVSTA